MGIRIFYNPNKMTWGYGSMTGVSFYPRNDSWTEIEIQTNKKDYKINRHYLDKLQFFPEFKICKALVMNRSFRNFRGSKK